MQPVKMTVASHQRQELSRAIQVILADNGEFAEFGLLRLSEVHWDYADPERRMFYLASFQLQPDEAKKTASLRFDDFDIIDRHALCSAVIHRCPELIRALAQGGFL